jgi:hypothetical protein
VGVWNDCFGKILRQTAPKMSNVVFKEILSGKRPYHELIIDSVVLKHILTGKVPSRPADVSLVLDDEMWATCRDCWKLEPAYRPSMRTVTFKVIAAHTRQEDRSD